jgi:hypothetical protein
MITTTIEVMIIIMTTINIMHNTNNYGLIYSNVECVRLTTIVFAYEFDLPVTLLDGKTYYLMGLMRARGTRETRADII